jgi:hypothetical protein
MRCAILLCAACGGKAAPQPASHATSLTCEGGGAKVVLDRTSPVLRATYFQDGSSMGTSECMGTRIQDSDLVCSQQSQYTLYFRTIPSTQPGGKLVLASGTQIALDCHWSSAPASP